MPPRLTTNATGTGERSLVRNEAVRVKVVVCHGNCVVRVQPLRPEPNSFRGDGRQYRLFVVGEVVVVREHKNGIRRWLDVDGWLALLVELDDRSRAGDCLEDRFEPPTREKDAGRACDLDVADGLVRLLERVPDQRGRAALVGVESPELAPLESDRQLVTVDQEDPNVLPDGM